MAVKRGVLVFLHPLNIPLNIFVVILHITAREHILIYLVARDRISFSAPTIVNIFSGKQKKIPPIKKAKISPNLKAISEVNLAFS